MTDLEHGLILVVEDNPDDAALLRRAFDQARLPNPLYLAATGEEGMAYLRGEAPFEDQLAAIRCRRSCCSICGCPASPGFEVLEQLRRDPVAAPPARRGHDRVDQ